MELFREPAVTVHDAVVVVLQLRIGSRTRFGGPGENSSESTQLCIARRQREIETVSSTNPCRLQPASDAFGRERRTK
jgi:hypothetical protein